MAQNPYEFRDVIINGVTYPAVPKISVPRASASGNEDFFSTRDATAIASQILSGRTAYANGEKITGTMPNIGATGGIINQKAQTVTIPEGYTSGGTVVISSSEQAKIIAGNIRSGVTILGQAGSSSVVDTNISSDGAGASQILSGYKAYVNGSLVSGSLNVPTISQDSTTKVLSIS